MSSNTTVDVFITVEVSTTTIGISEYRRGRRGIYVYRRDLNDSHWRVQDYRRGKYLLSGQVLIAKKYGA